MSVCLSLHLVEYFDLCFSGGKCEEECEAEEDMEKAG